MTAYRAPRGTEDYLPDRIPLQDHVFRVSREVCERYGYREIRTPLFEETRLFVRSLGEVTDVVEKEMFTCERGDTSITFRPEATAGVIRAYLEHNLHKIRPFQKWFYIGPMFRFERPQAARQRQFHQVGIEAVGSRDPRLDAEVVHLGGKLLESLGIEGARVHLNSIGDREDRARYRRVLTEKIRPRLDEYCEDCRNRFTRNVFRILDCKVRGCRERNALLPPFLEHLGPESREHFEEVQRHLEALSRPFLVDPGIVRGLDYYTHTVFEWKVEGIGARDTVIGGGRYDDLVEELGGPSIPSIGFSLGVTGVLLAMKKQGLDLPHLGEKPCPLFVAAPGEEDRGEALRLAEEVRQAGLPCDLDFEGRSMKGQMRAADKRGASLVLILGEEERRKGVVLIRDMKDKSQREIPRDRGLTGELERLLASHDASEEG